MENSKHPVNSGRIAWPKWAVVLACVGGLALWLGAGSVAKTWADPSTPHQPPAEGEKPAEGAASEGQAPATVDPHAKAFAESKYPSAAVCSGCHAQIYDEWASSNHGYASISPMFQKFEQCITVLSQGTVGYFCMRCHNSVGTTLGEDRALPLWKRVPVSREGVTCITCHRVSTMYNKVSGERLIDAGDITQPVRGNSSGAGVDEVVANAEKYGINPTPDASAPGMQIHGKAIKFDQLSQSEFCVSCHQVAVYPGIKLEVVWDQYRASPAFEQGITCQACHMGKVPGVAAGYAKGPVAVIGGKVVNPNREHHNHAFYGPGYPIAHPGIFPHNPRNDTYPIETWLKFDYRAGWGKEDFEEKVASGAVKVSFPKEWEDPNDRDTARQVIEENLKKLEYKRSLRLKVMENGSHIDGPFFDYPPAVGKQLNFHYIVKNVNPGHNMPSGSLGAQPEIWLNVALVGPDGKNIWESGYVDREGDMCDLHSEEVGKGTIPHDDQLVNLQTKFLTTNVKGTDREMFLPINLDVDQLPFIRPSDKPITVLNHPPFIRMEGRSIPPLGQRKAGYFVPKEAMKQAGTYRMSFRMRSRAEPIYFMKFVGSTDEMIQSMNEWMIDMHPYTVEFEVK